MSKWEIGQGSFDGVWSQGPYVTVSKDGNVVKEYSPYNPIAGLLARLYVLRHRIFG